MTSEREKGLVKKVLRTDKQAVQPVAFSQQKDDGGEAFWLIDMDMLRGCGK